MKAPVYIFLGPPGSGKDTQAELIASHLGGVPVISTGEMFRQEARKGSHLSLEVEKYTLKGELVPDDLLFAVLEEYLKDFSFHRGLIFTGFPRTENQARLFSIWLEKYNLEVGRVIHLETSPETSVARILTRVKEAEGNPRADDLEESAVKERLRAYQAQVSPLLKYYQQMGLLVNIANEGSIEEVASTIKTQLNGR